ncbi:alpha/beta fold hydrolase, partial [Frankia sp. AvcI1]
MPTTVRTEVLDISVEVTGPADGPPVVLLHGWPDAARGWHGVQAGLNERGWRTIVPDLRGSGATRFRDAGTPRDGQAVALAQDALDLADALGLGRIAVV